MSQRRRFSFQKLMCCGFIGTAAAETQSNVYCDRNKACCSPLSKITLKKQGQIFSGVLILRTNILSWKICIKTRSFVSSGKVLTLEHAKIMRPVKTYILNIYLIPWSKHVKLHISMKDARVNTRLNISHFIVAPLKQLNNRRRKKHLLYRLESIGGTSDLGRSYPAPRVLSWWH